MGWYHRECGDHQGNDTSGEMAMENHCSMDDDPPTYGVCHLRLRGPQTDRTEAEEAFREEVNRLAGLSDGQTMLCVAGDFNAHIDVVEPGDEESIERFERRTRNREGRDLVEMLRRNG